MRHSGKLSNSINGPSHHLKYLFQLKTPEECWEKASCEKLPGKT